MLFRFDAEWMHRLTIQVIQFVQKYLGSHSLRWVSGADSLENYENSPGLKFWGECAGLKWLSPVGLAAGFDKDAEILEAIPHLGFGFAEIGTVTPLPQSGNPLPRLFRDADKKIIFNRMGFNNRGAIAVARHVMESKPNLPDGFRVGINVGKNKDTPQEKAAQDYVKALQPFRGLADYVVVNVSSPNTPGLRDLQKAAALRPIIESVANEIRGWGSSVPPLFLKLAPELTGENFIEVLHQAPSWGVAGWILTNTLQGEWKREGSETLSGGLSGQILTTVALERLKEAKKETALPIISVGGIMTSEDAVMRLRAGASLIQLYAGWIFGGPRFPKKVEKTCRLQLKTQKP